MNTTQLQAAWFKTASPIRGKKVVITSDGKSVLRFTFSAALSLKGESFGGSAAAHKPEDVWGAMELFSKEVERTLRAIARGTKKGLPKLFIYNPRHLGAVQQVNVRASGLADLGKGAERSPETDYFDPEDPKYAEDLVTVLEGFGWEVEA